MQSLGPQWGPIHWSGKLTPRPAFRGGNSEYYEAIFDPVERAKELDLIAVKGDPVDFVWGQLHWKVVVTDFSFDIHHAREVDYTIDLEVVQDFITQPSSPNLTFEQLTFPSLITALVATTDQLLTDLQNSALLAVLGAEAIAAINSGQSALGAAAALATAEATAQAFGVGLPLIQAANQVMYAAGLIKAIAETV